MTESEDCTGAAGRAAALGRMLGWVAGDCAWMVGMFGAAFAVALGGERVLVLALG